MQGKDGPGKDSRGTLPRPCNSAYGPEDKKCLQSQPQASEQLILQKLGLFLTCHMVSHTLWRDASPKSVPTTSGYVSTAPGLGLPGGLATPHLQSGRGRPSPLPIHGHLCTVLHPTGVKDDHAQGTMPAQHRRGLSSP